MDSWVYAMPEDDFVAESMSFQAQFATVEDEG